MRFTVEQMVITDADGKPVADRETTYHVVEADTLGEALTSFLSAHDAEMMGTIQRFHGAQATATGRQGLMVFTLHLMPGSDVFRGNSARTSPDETRAAEHAAGEIRPDQRER
jgi:hypothetical protein